MTSRQRKHALRKLTPAEIGALPGFEVDTSGLNESVSGELTPAAKALRQIRDRSFSGRHPELGKMIKCQVCGIRHRKSLACEQRILTSTTPGKNPDRHILGAAHFAKKRLNKHPSRKQFQLIALVRNLVSDDATPEDVKDAKELAKEILGWNKKNTYGTWIPKRRTEVKSKESLIDSLSEKELIQPAPSEIS